MGKSRLDKPLPWYQWDPQQWQASRKVARMDWAARGMYRELMDECWIKGAIPSTAEGIADLLDVPVDEVEPLISQFVRCFDIDGESQTMTSPFIEAIRTESDARRISQANRRLGKDKHGNPKLSEAITSDPRLSTDNQSEVQEKRREENIREENIREENIKEENIKEENNPPLPPKGARVKVEHDPRESEILTLWNTTAAKCGFAQAIGKPGKKRMASIRARLAEPGWWELVPNALAFLEASQWHRENPQHASIDTFLRPEKVQQYAEKANLKPTMNGASNGRPNTDRQHHRSAGDDAYRRHLLNQQQSAG